MSWSPCPDPKLGNRESVEAIEMMLVPRAVDLAGMDVRRVLPSRERQMVGPFIFFDQMGPAEFLTDSGLDVRPHPHINLATLTYLFDGEIVHRDSLGSEQTIRPGEINWMKAGRGIVHSERTDPQRRRHAHDLFGIQSWVALPEDHEESEPEFKHFEGEDVPVVDSQGLRARVLAGTAFGEQATMKTPSPALYAEVSADADTTVPIDTKFDERAIYTLGGDVRIDGCTFGPHRLLVFRPGTEIHVEALEDAHFMLFGGDPMESKRYIWWNFVSSRKERIEQAKEEWANGLFETVPGDEEDFIPLPGQPST
mgnify:FL=1